MALPIFTIQSFNQSALQPAGAVFAQRVESINVGKSTFTGFSTANTGRNTGMEKKMNDLTKAVLSELNSQAKATYPNAVALVDLNLHFSNLGKTGDTILLAGQAAATALIKRKSSEPQVAPMSQPAPVAMMSQPVAAPVPAPMMSQPMAAPVAMMSQPVAAPVAAPVPMMSQPAPVPVPLELAPSQPIQPQGGRRKRNMRSRKNRR